MQRTLDGSVQRRSQSSKGRYESKMWREAGLEEPGANLNAGAAAVVDEDEVDNLEAVAASSRALGGSQLAPSQQSSQHTREGRPWGRHR